MKKYVFIAKANEVMNRIAKGKHIEGTLFKDKTTGRLTFKPYNRQTTSREPDSLIKKLPWGWVKESMERIRVHGSFPKNMGTAAIIWHLDDNTIQAKNALIERELLNP